MMHVIVEADRSTQLFVANVSWRGRTNKALDITLDTHTETTSGVWILRNRWMKDKKPLHKS